MAKEADSPNNQPTTDDRQPDGGEIRQRIAEGLVSLTRDACGRGPESARVYIVDDLVACVLRGGYTRLEQSLLEADQADSVIRLRMQLQDLLADRFKALITEVTGRKVVAFMSANHDDPDMFCETFILAPDDVAGDQSADAA